MAFMLGRHGVFLELNEDVEEYEDLTEIMSNVQLNSNFLALAREVSVWLGSSPGAAPSWDLLWLPSNQSPRGQAAPGAAALAQQPPVACG